MNPAIAALAHILIIGKASSALQQVNAKIAKSGMSPVELEVVTATENWLVDEAKKFGFDLTEATS